MKTRLSFGSGISGATVLGFAMAGLLTSPVCAQSTTSAQAPATAHASTAVKPLAQPVTAPPPMHHASPMSEHAREHYQLLWGVDALDVKAVESGQMIRFSYYVLDPVKAAQLNDKKSAPFLIDEQAHVKLEIPTMEKVGQLRQSASAEAGKSYWMVFSNKGSIVKPGDRVTIVIGRFRADGLYVR